MSDEGITKLVTKAEREQIDDSRCIDEAHAEALAMLEKAKELIRAHDRRVTGLAIAVAFEDGAYGRLVPTVQCRTGLLIGAVGTMHHDLILRTLVPPE